MRVIPISWQVPTVRLRLCIATTGTAGILLAGCGASGSAESGQATDRPTVAVTTTILADVVDDCVGDQIDVVTIMAVGADPHAFQASARHASVMRQSDALIVNGAGFEEGLLDVIDAASDDGTPTFEAISAVETIELGDAAHHPTHEEEAEHGDVDAGHDEDAEHDEDAGHDEDEHAADHAHENGSEDPHFFTDPSRVAISMEAMTGFLVENVDGIDPAALEASVEECVAGLNALDLEVEATLATVPAERRVLVTNHAVFGYLAERYGFEVLDTVIPSGSTTDGASARDLTELAEVIAAEDVPAIFTDASSTSELADTVAAETGGIAVVELYSESLGEPGSDGETYADMVRTNAQRIAHALG